MRRCSTLLNFTTFSPTSAHFADGLGALAILPIWAKPRVDEALADVERGDVITLEGHEARTKAFLAAIKS
jgi:hypothetical protein